MYKPIVHKQRGDGMVRGERCKGLLADVAGWWRKLQTGWFLPRVSLLGRFVMPARALKELEIGDVADILNKEECSPPFFSCRVESDIDSLGDPALWVWVVYDVKEVDLEAAHQAERKIQSLILEAGDERWVYVRFRTCEEDADIDEDNDKDSSWSDDSAKSGTGSVNS